jgi:undecaprenyl-diphosphatase
VGILEAIVYGIVQGATEFLPISSTAHIRIVPSLLGWQDPGASFTAVIQLGTLLAVLIYFGKDLSKTFMGWLGSLTDKSKRNSLEAKIGWGIVIGTLPIVIFGFAFKDQIKSAEVRSLYVIAFMLIFMGVVLAIAERVGKRQRSFGDLTVKDGIWVGLWQAVALIPGASRSGSTITGALFGGLDRPTAARFSFLLSVPSILAAGMLEVVQERDGLMSAGVVPVVVASVVSFFVGYAAIAFLMKMLQTKSTAGFIVYRIALGIALLVMLQQGVLTPTTGIATEAPAVSTQAP